ncbi:MAG: hypothetical protein ACHQT9_03370 [Candidatus Saccharimonadales bacterium]
MLRASRPLAVLTSAVALGGCSEAGSNHSGIEQSVSSAQIQQLGASTVLLLDRSRNSSEPWHPACSGTKVAIGGSSNYVVTAAHCLDFSFDAKRNRQAVNVLPYTSHEYIVANRVTTKIKHQHGADLIGQVAAAAYIPGVGKNGPDLDLLKITDKTHKDAARFNRIPALPFSRMGGQPSKGQSVVVESYPTSVTGSLTSTVGEYIGRITTPPFFNREGSIDVVGLKVSNAVHDACEHGGSGSSFVSPAAVSGPLSYRSETGHETNEPLKHPTKHEQAIGQTKSQESRSQLQAALHMDLSQFNVVCTFTVPPPNIANSLVEALK